jgi:hypothetical protein
MQLKIARLCLDCDEVHSEPHCPICASEAFAYLTRWVPAPERRIQPRPTTSPAAEVYRELTSTTVATSRRSRLLRRSAFGVTALTAAGWLWRWSRDRGTTSSTSTGPELSLAASDGTRRSEQARPLRERGIKG